MFDIFVVVSNVISNVCPEPFPLAVPVFPVYVPTTPVPDTVAVTDKILLSLSP